MRWRNCHLLLILATALAIAPVLSACETDQFTLPNDHSFADLGSDITHWYYEALDQGVSRANSAIAEAIARHASAEELAELQSNDGVVKSIDGVFLRGNDIVDAMEEQLQNPALQSEHPGQRVYFREVWNDVYRNAFFPLDPRILSRFYIGSTVKAFGVYFGTDKFGHFSAIGISYYWSYIKAIRDGQSEQRAIESAVANGTTGFNSEAGMLGLYTAGDYSNADLAANFSGFLFFRNLTQRVTVHGQSLPPLLVRSGLFWKLAPHVRPRSDFFKPFISDHWNEALNPGYFIEEMRPTLREAVAARSENILRYYSDPPFIASPRYFQQKRHQLETYYGQDYGHRGNDDSLVTIDRCCFPAP